MALVITYRDGWPRPRVLKGQLHNGRPRQWSVEVGFTHSEGPQRIRFKTEQACHLTELGDLIEERLLLEGKVFGPISNIHWTATHWR